MQDVEMTEVEQVHPLQTQFEDAEDLMTSLGASSTPDAAIQAFQSLISYAEEDAALEQVQRVKEHSIYKLAQLYIQYGREKELATLLQSLRPFFATLARAKTGKIVRTVIDMVAKVKVLDSEKALQLQADLCLDSIEWCTQEKHTFLRQRAALTAARSISNTIYVVPRTQAQIDQMSGILHAEERDYKTAYSYFFEAFEALSTLDEVEGLKCLKYMLLAKIASGGASEVNLIINSKQAMKFIGIDLEAMQAVAKAHEQRSLELFEAATQKYAAQLVEDPLIKTHLGKLYEQLLESNLIKIIQPFSCVEIEHVAKLIKLPLAQIELKLSQMILDHKFHGILDQGKGQLIVYDSPTEDKTYTSGLGVIENVGNIVDNLFRRAEKLHA
ncbi:hypothetical protein BBO99_00005710 [Phytophthora kernoviae]|uniref:PCI domain-containing protein n=2 Tax=Phytophthora kernoviae TaxID=325452 RepID=A0A3R7K388_9STRA|nr:hypothetical protein G195_006461 [Phytophthora kernoviae 00238/432]KAG2522031.1 hypothetical protein JM18_005067 [Phytophthora kernoviae]RLN10553.1 hypothetical protein BBI17_005742 [Phytophthora kernoviae]RLN78809.1 hypothetical protein BBO99_00005710 [Phytophthora kernoviae]